jgi:hypothetical protein
MDMLSGNNRQGMITARADHDMDQYSPPDPPDREK